MALQKPGQPYTWASKSSKHPHNTKRTQKPKQLH